MSRPAISFIVARADNGVIGHNGGLPWRLSADLRHFKRLTLGKPVIMGRKTFESIGKPLVGRHNIVLTRDAGWRAEGITIVADLAEAIAAAQLNPGATELMIIGGAQLYAEALPIATRAYLTEREQVSRIYHEVFRPVRLRDGRTIPALCYVVNQRHRQYAGRLSREEQLRMVEHSSGSTGPNRDYICNTAKSLDEIGVEDRTLRWLSERLS